MVYQILFIVLLLVFLWRVYSCIPNRIKPFKSTTRISIEKPINTLVVLGSGGHTTEMCTLVQSLIKEKRNSIPLYQFTFLIAQTDNKSADFATTKLSKDLGPLKIHYIPRSREVKQSLVSSIFTTLWAFLKTVRLTLFEVQPDLILVNGPGTCVPICVNAYIAKFFGKMIKIIYVESLARVRKLSTTGWIMRFMADRLIVQWKPLFSKHSPQVDYVGRLC
ncbi:beta-1,4-N-acetylglucosaminyltransferase [Acrasis kona]|uniref:UDP-N-acetylglucosamine transferase subunit ALG14 n=1 Tax=Acrasis kona TaxID=1008807 RepID=A0AAW2ZCJ9_9EUKA